PRRSARKGDTQSSSSHSAAQELGHPETERPGQLPGSLRLRTRHNLESGRSIDKGVLDSESPFEMLCESAHSPCLGGVVAAEEDVDSFLHRVKEGVMVTLACQERIQSDRGRLADASRRTA